MSAGTPSVPAVESVAGPRPVRALFLDRDGVVNVEKDYLYRIEDFEFVPGIFELAETARELGFLLVVITNQSGIGRGYYTEADFHKLTDWMKQRFRERGSEIAGVYFCPYHPEQGVGRYKQDSPDRKPNPGMLLKARDAFGLDLAASVIVGDQGSDMEAGRRAGVGTRLLLKSSKSATGVGEDAAFACLADAAAWLRRRAAPQPG